MSSVLNSHPRSEAVWPGAFLFSALGFIKAPQILLQTRFWAEEGTHYFGAVRELSSFDSLLYVTNGNFQLLTNILVYLSTLIPLKYAPVITTYGAFAVQVLVAGLLWSISTAYGAKAIPRIALVVGWAFLPHTYEVWATATNVQWTCSVSMLLILAAPRLWAEKRLGRVALWTAVCGLTGVPSCMLTPGFALRGLAERSWSFLALAGVLAICSVVQLIVIRTHGVTARPLSTDLSVLLPPFLLQTVLTPLVGVEITNAVATSIRATGSGGLSGLVLSAAAGLIAVLSIAVSRSPRLRPVCLVVVLQWVLVSLLNSFGALGDPKELISGLTGARYFLYGSMSFCIVLALGSSLASRALSRVATILLLIIASVAVAEWRTSDWVQSFTSGPSWPEQIAACVPEQPCTVTLWPGPPWSLRVR